MSSPLKTRPLRRPPPRLRRSLSLPVLPELPPQARGNSPAPLPQADPFNPHKILNHIDRLQKFTAGELVYPITVEIDPTNLCNHRCQWCVSIEAHTGEVLPLERIKDLAEELKRADVRSIVLKGGGEPTTHPHFIEILDSLRSCGLAIGLITNGSMPRPGSVEHIIQACQWVRVSLDAATPQTHKLIHGTSDFNKIIANIRHLIAAQKDGSPMVGLNFVAEPRNYGEMVQFARLGRELNVSYVTIRCVFDPASPPPEDVRAAMRQQALAAKAEEGPDFRVFLGNFTDRYINATPTDAFPHARCLGPNLVGIIGGDGHVYACCFLRGNRNFSFGSIHEQSFREIWEGPKRQAVMELVYRGECNRVCAGGMTANRYNIYNEILNYMASESKPHCDFA